MVFNVGSSCFFSAFPGPVHAGPVHAVDISQRCLYGRRRCGQDPVVWYPCLRMWIVHSRSNLTRCQVSSLQWRHNGRDSVSNHQPHDCLLDRLFRRSSNKTSKLRVTGPCAGISPGTGEFPAQMAINAENVSLWWRHQGSISATPSAHKLIPIFTTFCDIREGLVPSTCHKHSNCGQDSNCQLLLNTGIKLIPFDDSRAWLGGVTLKPS